MTAHRDGFLYGAVEDFISDLLSGRGDVAITYDTAIRRLSTLDADDQFRIGEEKESGKLQALRAIAGSRFLLQAIAHSAETAVLGLENDEPSADGEEDENADGTAQDHGSDP